MFKRRRKRSLAERLRDVFWPRMPWRRIRVYYKHRMGRLPGTPYFIAAGFATGLLGFAQVFWDANRQAIHDRISGTVVIRDGAEPLPEPTRRLRSRESLNHEPRAEP